MHQTINVENVLEDVLSSKSTVTIKQLKEYRDNKLKEFPDVYIDITTESLNSEIARNSNLKWVDNFTIEKK